MPSQQKPKPFVFVLGDSISIQYGPYLEKFLSPMFRYARKDGEAEALLNLDNPTGANGGDSSMVLHFLEAQLSRPDFRPDILLLNCGLHDIKRKVGGNGIQVPIEAYRENLEAVIRLIASREIHLVWVRTTPVIDEIHNRISTEFHRHAEDCAAHNAASDEIMQAHGIPLLDLHTFSAHLGRDAFCDHVHYHESARQLQAAYISGWLDAWWKRKEKNS